MEWVETTGRTIEEATQAALELLGVSRGDAEVIVVDEGGRSLFGLFRRGEARVRARVRPVRSEMSAGGRSRRARWRRGTPRTEGSGNEGRTVVAAGSQAGGAGSSAHGRGSRRRRRRSRKPVGIVGATQSAAPGGCRGGGAEAHAEAAQHEAGAPRAASVVATAGQAVVDDGGEDRRPGKPAADRGDTERCAGPGGSDASAERTVGDGVPTTSGDRQAARREVEPVAVMNTEEQARIAAEFVQGLLGEAGFRGEVSTEATEGQVEVRVIGEGLGVLIGHRGQTLGALQELTRTVVQRRVAGKPVRVIVDVAGYRARRRAALERFTRQIAEEVLATGEPRALEPMPPADRKVVHDTINAIQGLRTRSEGTDPRRFIVIERAEGGAAT
jgi:spoIIIJ-associated protein